MLSGRIDSNCACQHHVVYQHSNYRSCTVCQSASGTRFEMCQRTDRQLWNIVSLCALVVGRVIQIVAEVRQQRDRRVQGIAAPSAVQFTSLLWCSQLAACHARAVSHRWAVYRSEQTNTFRSFWTRCRSRFVDRLSSSRAKDGDHRQPWKAQTAGRCGFWCSSSFSFV